MSDLRQFIEKHHADAKREGLEIRFADKACTALVIAIPEAALQAAAAVDTAAETCPPHPTIET